MLLRAYNRALGRYNWERFLGDCAGGLIAALIALPYGLSMAALMGLPPILGVVTSLCTAPITALLGRNPVLIGGTASATVPFIAEAVRSQGIGGAAKVSIVASVLMMAFCVLRLGRYASKVPAPVVAGFSAGIGAIMVVSQLNVIFGVAAPHSDNSLVQLATVLQELTSGRWGPFILAATVMAVAALVMRFSPRLPAPLIGVALSGAVAVAFRIHEPQVGTLHLTLPPFAGFSWTPQDVLKVLPTGLTLAFVASINLLLTSRAVEHFRGRHKHMRSSDADAELGAYGIANLAAGVFGAPMSVGIPARSVANVRCGGTTRISNLLHAVFLFLLVALGSGVLAHIPMAALAGVTAWMGLCLLDVSTWRRLHKMRYVDAGAFLATAIGVLVVNAVAAVLAGCAIYLIEYFYRRYMAPEAGMPGIPSVAE
ncbi:MAG TPA: SulP family inorganic anion transporter [Bryobacteraceae bacterium]|jgi:MFS superfamily sulfate permease-like transporter|nr:SulP family inorganic anion transporter [Bryobacteraceae bacterium]